MTSKLEKKLKSKIYKRNGNIKKERRPLLYYIASFILPRWYGWKYGLKFMGLENLPKNGAFILASSHVNARDPLFVGCSSTRKMQFMAKAELFNINPFVTWAITYAGAFPVERGTGGEEAINYAIELLNSGRMVTVFIEGTRSKDGHLGKPKTGVSLLAEKTGAPVVPCAIIGENGEIPKKGGRMRINFGKPVTPEQLGITDESGMSYRRGAKNIMAEIAVLREEAVKDMDK
ncbi:MAG: lysophospholipid acyltransferase family protein [Clostridia bacterium]|nr:lysophospholipid acyltransferase family protein [Clostridia bacterium]